MQRLLVTGTVRPVVRKKAALCLLRLFRRNPDVLNKEEWCAAACATTVSPALTGSRMRRADALPTLLDERDHGLLTSVLSFLQALVVADSARCAVSCDFSVRREWPDVRLLQQLPRMPGQGCAPPGPPRSHARRAA